MRVVACLGDSMAMPRKNVPYKDTWCYMLKSFYSEHPIEGGVDFASSFRRALMSSDAIQQYLDLVGLYDAELLIVQIGITDCAPRRINDRLLFWKLLIKIAGRMHLTAAFWNVVKKMFKRNKNTVYTSKDKYEQNMRLLVNKFLSDNPAKQVLFILIASPSEYFLSRSKFVGDNIRAYNTVLKQICQEDERVSFINPLDCGDKDLFVEDGYHPSAKGNRLVFDALKDYLEHQFIQREI